jgi:hypothetical protein
MKVLGVLWVIALPLIAADFRDDVFQLNARYDESRWQVVPSERYRDRLVLKHISLPATMNILAYRYAEPVKANELVQNRIQSVYDGWELLSNARLTPQHNQRMGITGGERSIYRKTYLTDDLIQGQQLVADVCLVTDNTLAIVINVMADGVDTMLAIKNEFNQFYASFWWGNHKPQFYAVENSEATWIMPQQHWGRRRYLNYAVSVKDDMRVRQYFPVERDHDDANPAVFFNSNAAMALAQETIMVFDTNRTVSSVNIPLKNPHIQLATNGFYAIQNQPNVIVEKYNVQMDREWSYKYEADAHGVAVIDDHVLILHNDRIDMQDVSGVIWSTPVVLQAPHWAAHGNRLYVVDDATGILTIVELNRGQILKTLVVSESPSSQFDIALVGDAMIIINQQADGVTQITIDTQTNTIHDQATFGNVRSLTVCGFTDYVMVAEYTDLDGERYLGAFDFRTLANVWQEPLSIDSLPAIVTKKFVLLMDPQSTTLYQLELTTGAIHSGISLGPIIDAYRYTQASLTDPIRITAIMPLPNQAFLVAATDRSHYGFFYIQ